MVTSYHIAFTVLDGYDVLYTGQHTPQTHAHLPAYCLRCPW